MIATATRLDPTEVFLAQLSECPTFSAAEEADLARRRDAGDAEALDLLVRSVMPWCYKVARRHFPRDVSEASLMASIAAWRAAKGFDPAKGRLTTYSYRAAHNVGQRHRQQFRTAITRPSTNANEITDREAYRKAGRVISFALPLFDGDGSIGDTIAACGTTPAEDAATNEVQRQRREWVGWILRKMQPRYAAVLRERMREDTLDDIGGRDNLSRERIRQIERRAQESFRRWAERFPLLTFIRRWRVPMDQQQLRAAPLGGDVRSKATLAECITAITSAASDEISREEDILREEIAELKREIKRRLDTIKMLRKFRGKQQAAAKAASGPPLWQRIHALLLAKGPMKTGAIAIAVVSQPVACYSAMLARGGLFRQPSRGVWEAIEQ